MFYLYDKDSTLIIDGKDGRADHRARYKTMAAAKAAITRLAKKEGKGPCDSDHPMYRLGIADCEWFHTFIEKHRTVKSMMGGKEYSEPVNTPNYMSPASEAYWSM